MEDGYVYPTEEYKRGSRRSCNQRERSCINHDTTPWKTTSITSLEEEDRALAGERQQSIQLNVFYCAAVARGLRWKDRWLPASAFSPLENCLRRSRGIVRHCSSAATGSSERRTRHSRAETRDEKTLNLKVQCPIFGLIYDFCVGKTYYIAHKIH